MRTLHVHGYVDSKGKMTIAMPVELADQELDLIIVYEPVTEQASNGDMKKASAWPAELFDATAGAWQGTPLVRESEGGYEVRDALP